MELRFQPFHVIDSFRTLCPLKDIETCADAADKHIMDGFCLFFESPRDPLPLLVVIYVRSLARERKLEMI